MNAHEAGCDVFQCPCFLVKAGLNLCGQGLDRSGLDDQVDHGLDQVGLVGVVTGGEIRYRRSVCMPGPWDAVQVAATAWRRARDGGCARDANAARKNARFSCWLPPLGGCSPRMEM